MLKTCTIENCSKKVSARGYCSAHYSKWQRHGDPRYIRQYEKVDKCSVDGCDRGHHAKGYCGTHWAKIKRSGTLEYIRETPEYKQRWLDARITAVSKLDGVRDPKSRGFLATNVISDIKHKARKRQIPWNLEPTEAYDLITAECYYCGFDPNWPAARCGIDRVDNFRGYNKNNVVACCYTCNTAKGTKTQDEFRIWVMAIAKNFLKD